MSCGWNLNWGWNDGTRAVGYRAGADTYIMTTREKFIVAAVVMAVGYAVVSLFQGSRRNPSGGRPGPKVGDLQAFVAHSRGQLAVIRLSAGERAVLDATRLEWNGEPFAVFDGRTAVKTDGSGPSVYRYTGFVQAGGVRFAIVNGREYRENEPLLDGSGVVETIAADRVVLRVGDDNSLRTIMFENSGSGKE